jgi:DNA-binding GntR family transcriptional regulator
MPPRSPFVVEAHERHDLEIARESLDESVAAHLRAMIVRGEAKPGEKLNIAELAQSFGVSQTPLREALKILAEEQIVEWLPGRGVRVAPIGIEETTELFEVIATLEGLAAEFAAVLATEAQLVELEIMHAQMRRHFLNGEREPYFELNSQIHARLIALARNRVLRETHSRLNTRASRGRYLAIIDDARWREAMQEHEDLMVALRDRDVTRAGTIWRRHLSHTGAAVRSAQIAEARDNANTGVL